MSYFRQKLRKLKDPQSQVYSKGRAGQITESARLALLPDFPNANIAVETDQPDFPQTLNDENQREFELKITKEEKPGKDTKPKYSNGMTKQQAADQQKVGRIIRNKIETLNNTLLRALQEQTATTEEQKLIKRYGAELNYDKKKDKHYIFLKRAYQVYEDIVGQQFQETPELFHPDFSVSNSKLANEAIVSWSLPHRRFCPGAGSVCRGCYVDSGPISFREPTVRRWMNFFAAQNPNFVDEAIGMLQQIRKNPRVTFVADFDRPTGEKTYEPMLGPDGTPRSHEWDHVRWHDAGDFYSPFYINLVKQIIERTPWMHHYWYTKSHSVPELKSAMDELSSLPNTKQIQSVGGAHDDQIDPQKPIALVFPERDYGTEDGWQCAYNSDRVAADPSITKVALAAHAGLKGKLDLNDHVKKAPQIHEMLPKALDRWNKEKGLKKTDPMGPPSAATPRKPPAKKTVRRMSQYFRRKLK